MNMMRTKNHCQLNIPKYFKQFERVWHGDALDACGAHPHVAVTAPRARPDRRAECHLATGRSHLGPKPDAFTHLTHTYIST